MRAPHISELPERVAAALTEEMRTAIVSLSIDANESGIALYLVGGLVRDCLLLDRPPVGEQQDADLAVEGEIGALAAAGGVRRVSHDRFGTATMALSGGGRIDLAQTRSERYPAPAALPLVRTAPIEIDLGRRDFTINAAAFGLTGPHAGELLDPHRGARDARRRRLRTLHDASFEDDPTRLIRACRYAARIEGRLEADTARRAQAHRASLAQLSEARFGDAWRALLHDPAAVDALRRSRRLGLPRGRLPGWEVAARSAAALSGDEDAAERWWAAVGLTTRERRIIERLPSAAALHRAEREALAAGAALRAQRRRIGAARRSSDVVELVGRAPTAAIQAAARLWDGPSKERLDEFLERRTYVRSPLDGAALLKLGVEHGPAVGEWLARLERAVWDGELGEDQRTRTAAARRWVRSSPDGANDPTGSSR